MRRAQYLGSQKKKGSEVEGSAHRSRTMKAETNLQINNMEAISDLDKRSSDEWKGENIICMCS